MNLRRWLVSLYPHAWRERYSDEFASLIEESLRSPLDVLDILLGALDARFEFTDDTNWRFLMTNKLRTSALLVFAAYIAFIVAGMTLNGLADDSPFIPMMKTDIVMYASWLTIHVGAVLAFLAIVVGGAPLAWTIIRRAFTSQRKDLHLLLVPFYSFLALVLYFLGMLYMNFATPLLNPPNSPPGHYILWGFATVFVLGALASAAAVWKVVSHTDVEEGTLPLLGPRTVKLYEFTFVPAVIATICMTVMFVSSIIWLGLAYSARPDMLTGNLGPMLTNTRGALAFLLILMIGAVMASLTGIKRGFSSRRLGRS